MQYSEDHSWHLCKILLQNHVLKNFLTSSYTICKVSTISLAESTSILSYFWDSHTWIFQIARELYKQILLVTSTLTVKKGVYLLFFIYILSGKWSLHCQQNGFLWWSLQIHISRIIILCLLGANFSNSLHLPPPSNHKPFFFIELYRQ